MGRIAVSRTLALPSWTPFLGLKASSERKMRSRRRFEPRRGDGLGISERARP